MVAYLSDKVRVIECRGRIQWIIQRRRSVCPNSWRGVWYCRTREALLRYAGSGDPAGLIRLRALPERYPEAVIFDGSLDLDDDLAQAQAAA